MHLGDNTSAEAWLRKCSFSTKSHAAHNKVARTFGRLLMTQKARVTSCHVPGITNFAADMLSRDTHISLTNLQHILPQLFPHQVPASLTLVDLNDEITSELVSLKQLCHNRTDSPENLKRNSAGTSIAGDDTCQALDSMIIGWKDSIANSKTGLSIPTNFYYSPMFQTTIYYILFLFRFQYI